MSQASIAQLIDFSGRRAVITGSAQGLGFAVAKRLAEAGATIIGGDLNQAQAVEALSELPCSDGRAHTAWHLDVRSGASVGAFAQRIRETFQGADIWVNCAGILPVQAFDTMTEEQWDTMLDINLRGTFLCGRAAANLMTENAEGGGVIVNMSSTSGHRGRAGLVHYSASKHGVEGLTKGMAVELGPKGIRVVSIAPALTRTDGLLARRRADEESGKQDSLELENKVAQMIPLGRIGEPDDIAKVVLFVASDLASFVSGCSIPVDGGQLAF